MATVKSKVSSRLSYTLILSTLFAAGCATPNGAWHSAQLANTTAAYTRCARDYPDSAFAPEALRRTSDIEYAFLRTCEAGTERAWKGFTESYQHNTYSSIARARIEYLQRTRRPTYEAYKKFISDCPRNPFVRDAVISVPLLWLKEVQPKLGVQIIVGPTVFRGLLGGGTKSKEQVQKEIWEKLRRQAEKEGLHVYLLDESSPSPTIPRVSHIVRVDYAEQVIEPAPPARSHSVKPEDIYRDAAAANLAAIFTPIVSAIHQSVREIVAFSVSPHSEAVPYYSGYAGLASTVGSVDKARVLRSLNQHDDLPAFVITASGKPVVDVEATLQRIRDFTRTPPATGSR